MRSMTTLRCEKRFWGHEFPSSGHGQSHGDRHLNPFWSPGYPGPSSYDIGYTYAYSPSPEQQSTARKRINDYLVAVQRGKRHPVTHRYISVETLRPTKVQSQD
jgi:hypothetical protein